VEDIQADSTPSLSTPVEMQALPKFKEIYS